MNCQCFVAWLIVVLIATTTALTAPLPPPVPLQPSPLQRRQDPPASPSSSATATSPSPSASASPSPSNNNGTSPNAHKGGPSGKSGEQCGAVCAAMWDNYLDRCKGNPKCICTDSIAVAFFNCYNCDLAATHADKPNVLRTQRIFWAYEAKCNVRGRRITAQLAVSTPFNATRALHAQTLALNKRASARERINPTHPATLVFITTGLAVAAAAAVL